MSRTNFDTLLEAGCHFGHLKRKWNPAMAPYIFMERNGIHIIDLHKTVAKVDEAADALKQKAGHQVLLLKLPAMQKLINQNLWPVLNYQHTLHSNCAFQKDD